MGCDIQIVKANRAQFNSLAGNSRSVMSHKLPGGSFTELGAYPKFYHAVMEALCIKDDFAASQFDYIEITPNDWHAVREYLLNGGGWESEQLSRNEEFIRDMNRFFEETDLVESVILLYWD